MEDWDHVKICVLATLYDNNSSIQYELGERFLDNRVKPRKGQSALDLGCRIGRLAGHLATLVGEEGHVVGVDVNAKRLHVAERAISPFYKNTTFFHGDATLALEIGPIDVVFCNFVLHWVPNDQILSIMKNIFECVRPGGTMAATITLSTGALVNTFSLLTLGKTEAEAVGMQCHPVSYWVDLCKSVGFDVVYSYQDDDLQWTFENSYKLIDLVKAYTLGKVDGHTISSNDFDAMLRQFKIADTEVPVTTSSRIGEIIMQRPILG